MPFFEKDKSKIKMVGLTPTGQKNIIWYSPISQNNKKSEKIVDGMFRRFQQDNAFSSCRAIQFYEYPYGNENLIAECK